jgi:hypothetical protein
MRLMVRAEKLMRRRIDVCSEIQEEDACCLRWR